MSYDPENFTSHANKAIAKSLEFATENKNIELAPIHLAFVLFQDTASLAYQLASRAGNTNQTQVINALQKQLKRLSVQDPPPSSIHPNSKFMNVLKQSNKIAKDNKDSHAAVDHLLLALYEDADVASALSSVSLTKRRMEELIANVRGGRKVTGQNAESTYEALKKYGHDVVEQAAAGKLDPVYRS